MPRFDALPEAATSLIGALSTTGFIASEDFFAFFRDELLCRLRAKVFRPTGQGSGKFSCHGAPPSMTDFVVA